MRMFGQEKNYFCHLSPLSFHLQSLDTAAAAATTSVAASWKDSINLRNYEK